MKVSIEEAAKRLNIAVGTIKTYISKGVRGSIKEGWVDLDALVKYRNYGRNIRDVWAHTDKRYEIRKKMWTENTGL